MRPDYEDTELRKLWHPELDEDDRWEPPIPWWMGLIGGGLVMLVLGLMVALCIAG